MHDTYKARNSSSVDDQMQRGLCDYRPAHARATPINSSPNTTYPKQRKAHKCFRQSLVAPRTVANSAKHPCGNTAVRASDSHRSTIRTSSAAGADAKASLDRLNVITRAGKTDAAIADRVSSSDLSTGHSTDVSGRHGDSDSSDGGQSPPHTERTVKDTASEQTASPAAAHAHGTDGSAARVLSAADETAARGPVPTQSEPRPWLVGDTDEVSEYGVSALDERIMSGEFTDRGSTKARLIEPVRKVLSMDPVGPGRAMALRLAQQARSWERAAARKMPEATGDIREIVGQPVFVPLYKLFLAYGKIFRLSFGPKSFVVISDPAMAKQILMTNASKYSKGLLSEILAFVMGNGMIPADGEIWKTRRRAIAPSLHKTYIAAMVEMFGDSTLHATKSLAKAADNGEVIEMENLFSRLTLDIIGKAVFDYDFDSLSNDDPVIQAVYTALREAEYRSTYPIPYWNVPLLRSVVPRQKRCTEAMAIVNTTLDQLINKCKQLVETEDEQFTEEFVGKRDPSILHFLLASGDRINSKQLRDDLMTLLIAGHETTAAVLTWTLYCLAKHPKDTERLQAEVDSILGDRKPTLEDVKALWFTTRCLNESMRLYPQPPVLIRRALEDDIVGGFKVEKGSDIFISVWNLHRSPETWKHPNSFDPTRFDSSKGTPNELTENFSYLPFGGGKRKCIGDQFALIEAITALAMMMRRYTFELDPSYPDVGMTTGATIHTSNGLHMRVSHRQAP